MNQKKRNLILLLAATVLLSGMLWLLMRGGNEEGHSHADDVTQSDHDHGAHSGTLIQEAQGDLQTIVFRNQNAKYTAYLDVDKGEIAFKELDGYSVNSGFMEYVWYGVAQMIYQDIVGSVDDEHYRPADYGFDKPSLTVKATFASGKSYSFKAGKNVPGYDEDVYYVLLNGDKNIYACTLDQSFFLGNSYYLSDNIFYEYDKDIDEKKEITIGNITLSGADFKEKLVMKVNRVTNLSDPFYGYDYVVTSPINWPVKRSSASTLVYDLTYLMADDVAALKPSKAELKSYGLSKPHLTVSFTRNGKACVLYCSKPEKDTMYVMLKGGDIVYRLDTEALSILHRLSPETLYSVNEISTAVEAISGISIRSADVKCDIDVSRKKNENAVTENDLIYTYSVKVNGADVKYTAYTNFVKQLNNSAISHWNVKLPDGRPEVTLTLKYYDSYQRESDVIRFYRYSDREYAAAWGDYPVNTVTVTWLKQLLDDAGAF